MSNFWSGFEKQAGKRQTQFFQALTNRMRRNMKAAGTAANKTERMKATKEVKNIQDMYTNLQSIDRFAAGDIELAKRKAGRWGEKRTRKARVPKVTAPDYVI